MKAMRVHFNVGDAPFCGAKPSVMLLSHDEGKVTCKRCQHRLGLQDAV